MRRLLAIFSLASCLIILSLSPASSTESDAETEVALEDMKIVSQEVQYVETIDPATGSTVSLYATEVTYELESCSITYTAYYPYTNDEYGSRYIYAKAEVSVGSGCTSSVTFHGQLRRVYSGGTVILANGPNRTAEPGKGSKTSTATRKCTTTTGDDYRTYNIRGTSTVMAYSGTVRRSCRV